MKVDQFVAGNGGRAVAFPRLHLPDKLRTFSGKLGQQLGLGRDRVVRRSEKRLPVMRDGIGRQRLRLRTERDVRVRPRRKGIHRRKFLDDRRSRIPERSLAGSRFLGTGRGCATSDEDE